MQNSQVLRIHAECDVWETWPWALVFSLWPRICSSHLQLYSALQLFALHMFMLTCVDTSFCISKPHSQHLASGDMRCTLELWLALGRRDLRKRHLQTLEMHSEKLGNKFLGSVYPKVVLEGMLLGWELETRYPVSLILPIICLSPLNIYRQPKQDYLFH